MLEIVIVVMWRVLEIELFGVRDGQLCGGFWGLSSEGSEMVIVTWRVSGRMT